MGKLFAIIWARIAECMMNITQEQTLFDWVIQADILGQSTVFVNEFKPEVLITPPPPTESGSLPQMGSQMENLHKCFCALQGQLDFY